MVTVSLSNESQQVPACEGECVVSEAVQHLTWSTAPFPVYIHFILWPRKSNSVALAAAGRSTTLWSDPQAQATRKENSRKKTQRRIPPSPRRAPAVSEVRRIDSDREESSHWNETCLNNSLNVSFLAFQITRCEAGLLSAGRCTEDVLCPRGLRRRENQTACEFASLCTTAGPGFQAHVDNVSMLRPESRPLPASLTDPVTVPRRRRRRGESVSSAGQCD